MKKRFYAEARNPNDWESTNFFVDKFIYVAQLKSAVQVMRLAATKIYAKKVALFLCFISGI